MPRRLSPIEIAEGALLADVAAVFALLGSYVPAVGTFFYFLIPVVFTVLILRRGLRTALMAFCVSFFLVSVLTGFGLQIPLVFASGSGIYLGITMKRRLSNTLLITIGVMGSWVGVCVTFVLLTWLFGGSWQRTTNEIHGILTLIISVLGFVAQHIGLGGWWRSSAYPPLAAFAALVYPYWWIFLLLAAWICCWPLVMTVHYITNRFTRLLGYAVRPFPGGRFNKFALRARRFWLRQSVRRGLIGKRRLQTGQ